MSETNKENQPVEVSLLNFIILVDKGTEGKEEWHDSGYRVSAASYLDALVAAYRFQPLHGNKDISVLLEDAIKTNELNQSQCA